MEEFGVSGFKSGTTVAKKRRSTTSRRPRPDSQLLLEGRDPSPPSSTPSSDNGSKQSTDGSSGHDTSVRRKEVNLNSLVPKISSANRSEGTTNTFRRLKKDDRTSGDYDGFYGSGVQRPSRTSVSNQGFSESKRSSEGVLAPSNWKSYVRHRDRLSPGSHIDSAKSGADAHDMGQSEPAPNGSAENKLRKVKLKVGGVTRTIHAKSDADGDTSAKPSRLSDASRHKQKFILKDKPDDDSMPQDKGDGFQGVPWKDFGDGSFSSASKESSIHGKSADEFASRKQIDKAQSSTTFEPVRKSKRVPKRRVLDGAFDDDEDDEIRYLERLKTTKLNSDHGAQHDNGGSDSNKKQKAAKVSKRASYEEDEDFLLSRRSKEGNKKSRSDREPEDVDYVEDEEAGSDVSESGSKKQRKEPLDSLSDSRREFNLTTRQRALQSGKDGSGGNNTSLIEFPNGLPPAPPRKQKGKLSEVEQQLKKAEAAQRRRLQVEKAARESEAEAIRKILGQDSNRKKREDKLQKKREELAQEKAAKSIELAANAVRWVMGPSGTTVTFPESIGLPSIFDSKPCREDVASFWRDRWCGEIPLCVTCPDLFMIAVAPNSPVAQFLDPSPTGRVWAPTFRRNLRQTEISQLEVLLTQLSSFSLTDRPDKWVWRWDKSGTFSVRSAYSVVSDGGLRHGLHDIVWRPRSPLKVKVLIWRMSHGRLPTRDRLLRFLPDIDTRCVLCGCEEETLDHLFVTCSYSRLIWERLASFTLTSIPQDSILCNFMLKWKRQWQLKEDDKIWWLILHATLWKIWGERNTRVFSRAARDAVHLFECICRAVREWASLICNVNQSNSSLFRLLGG